MDDNGEDCVYFGRALERAEGAGGRKLHLAMAKGRAKQAVPPWQQEARDDEGRRRFHGAFTGGFSAGYFNSVGSKEVGADAAVPSLVVPSPAVTSLAVPLAAAVLLPPAFICTPTRRVYLPANPPRLSARPSPAFICPPTPRVYMPANPPRLSARQPPAFICPLPPPPSRLSARQPPALSACQPPAFICPPTPRVYLLAPPPRLSARQPPRVYLPATPPRLSARQPPAFICPPTPRIYLPANPLAFICPPPPPPPPPPAFICPPTPRVYLPANPSPSSPGWLPASFRSSRSQRAEVQPQRVEALMDADERHDAQRSAVAAHSAFDTFGFTAAERARHLAPAADRRPSVIPGGGVAELLAPAADSIGAARGEGRAEAGGPTCPLLCTSEPIASVPHAHAYLLSPPLSFHLSHFPPLSNPPP
ncbi:unnamed protein product [Closterium sp. NIES-65]|nr:unnamed protein product [Closterium sp. NIES-65]